MGILRSFNVGVSGLTATGQGMGVIADNIANAGTNGFKGSRAEFQDVLATSLKGIDGGDQFGAGVRLAHIKPIMTQGDVARTDSITDIAINGDGFFNIKAPFGPGYSRDGSFHFNKEGELVNSDEYPVLGYIADEKGTITNKMDPIKIGNTAIPAQGTSDIKLNINLDSRADVIPFNPEDPENTAQFAHSVTVYDNIGTQRLVTLFYEKTGTNQFKYHAMVDGADAEGGVEGKFMEMASSAGIFVNLRIGPYVCAEWTYGGLPAWLGQKEGVAFRQTNAVWQPAMEKWFNTIVSLMARGNFFATQGGPIVLVQVENELPATDKSYVAWCGTMAQKALDAVSVKVPLTMCNGETANNTINTCNGKDCSNFLETSLRSSFSARSVKRTPSK